MALRGPEALRLFPDTKMASLILGTARTPVWLLRSRPDQVSGARMRGDPPRREYREERADLQKIASPCDESTLRSAEGAARGATIAAIASSGLPATSEGVFALERFLFRRRSFLRSAFEARLIFVKQELLPGTRHLAQPPRLYGSERQKAFFLSFPLPEESLRHPVPKRAFLKEKREKANPFSFRRLP